MNNELNTEVEAIKQEKTEKKELKPISINTDGLIEAKDNTELMRYCQVMIQSGAVPDRFDTPQKLFGALMLTRGLGLPDSSVRQVANVHGTPSIFGDLPLALCRKHGNITHFKEMWFDQNYDVISFENKNLTAETWGAVCIVGRDGQEPQSFSFTLKDASQAGLWPDKNGSKPWMKYTSQMLRYRARSIALKSICPDLISGVSILEYDQHETITVERDANVINKADLNGLQ